jgi:hypothetical protein
MGIEVGCPSRVVHTRTVAPALVPRGTGSSPVTTVPSGAVHRADVIDVRFGDPTAGASAAVRTTAATWRRDAA